MSEIDHVGLWNRCLEIIRDNVPEQTYKTWFLPIIPLKYEDKTLVVQVPSQFFYEFLEDKFVDLLRKTLYKVIGEGTKLMYNVMVDKSSRKTVDLESTQRTIIPQKQVMDKRIPQIPVPELDPHLNPEYNFETFIEGYSNKLSRSVAEAVALNPAKTIFNPLFLYGASGVGKTHLANAIGTKIKELYPEKRVLYVSAHLFQVQYTDSVRNNTTNDFINFYQTIDILIIDDFGTETEKDWVNEKYYEIIDGRYTSRKITIFTSNYCISRLNYDERITNRILERSLEIPFPEESVREHIAETMKQQMIAGIMGGGK
jgi:chromosomal replication initiator protein